MGKLLPACYDQMSNKLKLAETKLESSSSCITESLLTAVKTESFWHVPWLLILFCNNDASLTTSNPLSSAA